MSEMINWKGAEDLGARCSQHNCLMTECFVAHHPEVNRLPGGETTEDLRARIEQEHLEIQEWNAEYDRRHQ